MSDIPACERVRILLNWARDAIRRSSSAAVPGSCETPYLDAVVLMAEVLGLAKERVLADLDGTPSTDERERYARLVGERCRGVPVSYILGRKEFYGRTFEVDPETLVPRPDTELLVEIALDLVDKMAGKVHLHDCCTGGGCVAISIAAERPAVTVTASDISEPAVKLAERNAQRLLGENRPRFWQSDLLGELGPHLERFGPPRIITANPPYLTDNDYTAMESCGWPEPRLALSAGPEGLAVVRRLVAEALTQLGAGGYLLCEHGFEQGPDVRDLFQNVGFSEVTLHRDLGGRTRVCTGCKEM
jgi:release factor glutamine methyltransferase